MKKTVLLYWAPGGNVENAAREIYRQFGVNELEIADIAGFDVNRLPEFDHFILGSATIGADVWTDAKRSNKWNEFFVRAEKISFSGKKVALFGLGDQVLYPDHFVDSLGYLKEFVDKKGATLVGKWPVEGYDFTDSEGEKDNMFFGLALDEDQQPELTPSRVEAWVKQIKKEFGVS
jgi:flavodoxin I